MRVRPVTECEGMHFYSTSCLKLETGAVSQFRVYIL